MKTFARIFWQMAVALWLGASGATAGTATWHSNLPTHGCGPFGPGDYGAVYPRNPTSGVVDTGSLITWTGYGMAEGATLTVTATPGTNSYWLADAGTRGIGHPWDGTDVDVYACPTVPYGSRVVPSITASYPHFLSSGGYRNDSLEIRQVRRQRRTTGGMWEDVGPVITLQPGESTSFTEDSAEASEWQYIAVTPLLTDNGFQANQVLASGNSVAQDPVPSPVTPSTTTNPTVRNDPFENTVPPVNNPVTITNQPRVDVGTAPDPNAALDANQDARMQELRDLLAGQYEAQRATDAARAQGDANNTARLEAAINRTTSAVNSVTNHLGGIKDSIDGLTNFLGSGATGDLGTGTNFGTGNLNSIAGDLGSGLTVSFGTPAAVAPTVSLPFSSLDDRLTNPTLDFGSADLAPYVAGVRAFLLLLVTVSCVFAAWRIIGRATGV